MSAHAIDIRLKEKGRKEGKKKSEYGKEKKTRRGKRRRLYFF